MKNDEKIVSLIRENDFYPRNEIQNIYIYIYISIENEHFCGFPPVFESWREMRKNIIQKKFSKNFSNYLEKFFSSSSELFIFAQK